MYPILIQINYKRYNLNSDPKQVEKEKSRITTTTRSKKTYECEHKKYEGNSREMIN